MDIEQLARTRLGNYEIENLLGRGGMNLALCHFRFKIHTKKSSNHENTYPQISQTCADYVPSFVKEGRGIL